MTTIEPGERARPLALQEAREFLIAARDLLDKARHESAYGDAAYETSHAVTKIEEALLWLKAAGHAGHWID